MFWLLLGTSMSIRIIFKKPMRCFKCWINYFWDKMYRLYEIFVYFYKFFRIMSFVFDLKYLSQNSINFNMLGVFWNPQDEQFSKLSLLLICDKDSQEIHQIEHTKAQIKSGSLYTVLANRFWDFCLFLSIYWNFLESCHLSLISNISV